MYDFANLGQQIMIFFKQILEISFVIMFVVIGTSFLNLTFASAGLGQEPEAYLSNLGLSSFGMIPVTVMIVLIEMALKTRPDSLNLYVVQGARKSGNMSEVILAQFRLFRSCSLWWPYL